MRRACGSRSDHVCPTSARGRGYGNPCVGERNPLGCSCCWNGRNGEDISVLRDECSGGDAIDIVPSREREEVPASSGADKNEFAKAAERDRFAFIFPRFARRLFVYLQRAPTARTWVFPNKPNGLVQQANRRWLYLLLAIFVCAVKTVSRNIPREGERVATGRDIVISAHTSPKTLRAVLHGKKKRKRCCFSGVGQQRHDWSKSL